MPDTNDLTATLRAAEVDLGGTLGVAASRLDGSDAVRYHDDVGFPAASTIKVYVLLALLELAQAGEADLREEIELTAEQQVSGSGVLKNLTPGRLYTAHDLARLMVAVSDNCATNLLIERVGVARVNEMVARRGWSDTHLAGLLQRPDRGTGERTSASVTSPRDLHDHFRRLWNGALLDAHHTRVAQDIYRSQQFTDQLGRYLPFDAYSTEVGESDLVIASKSGSIRGVRNDAGVIASGGGAYVLAVMTKGCPDERFHVDNLGSLVIGRVSHALYQHFPA